MLKHALTLYHHLPAPARDLAASLRGWYLRAWRYGPETERLVEEALERDFWSPSQWKSYQENRLAYILHRAATRVPYYRAYWQERRRRGDKTSWEYLENWPILEKEPLRQNPKAFVADDCNTRFMFADHTGGTTGTPLTIYLRRPTIRLWYALFEARLRRWNGVSRHENWAILGGQQVIPPWVQKPPYWVWNAPMNQLYLSANHISPQTAPAYVDALCRHNITHMIVYTSSATFLARQILDLGLTPPKELRVVLTNAEPLFPWQRQTLEQAFNCPVRETYGMGEVVAGASEDSKGKLRLWPEVGHLEVLQDDSINAVEPGEAGRLICTGLLNEDMPLIRYAVGDRCRLGTHAIDDADPVRLPIVQSIEGRTSDLLVTQDGRRVFWVNPVFYGLPIREAQIIQESLDRFVVRYVPADGFSSKAAESIKERLTARVGQAEILLEPVSQIPRGPNGKFRAVICKVPSHELNQVR